MFYSVRREVPEFLQEQTLYCDNLIQIERRNPKTCVVLARNLNFYEFRRKQLLHTIDLSATCLRTVAQRLHNYQGPQSRCFRSNRQYDETAASTSTMENSTLLTESTLQRQDKSPPEIIFGKYVYTNCGQTPKLYLLLRCWDKMIVMQRLPDEAGFKIIDELEQVVNFKLVHGKLKFHPVVEISFANGTQLCTDFSDKHAAETPPKDTTPMMTDAQSFSQSSRNDLKQLLERVRSVKTELQLHKSTTQMEFERLRDTQAFGRNLFRSFKLEEKQMLARCGDIWLRFTATNDALVIGVPLVNNHAGPNLTVMRNLRAVFKIKEAHIRGLSYRQYFYRLQQRFENLESLETFFQCTTDNDDEDEENEQEDNDGSHTVTWTCGDGQLQHQQNELLPESFAVLVLHLNISQIIALESCPLFLLFEIEREIDSGMRKKNKIYEQQIFLKNLNFSEVLGQRRHEYEIAFSPSTLHQDFLAIACACTETKLNIKFHSENDLAKFEHLITVKFNCEMLKRGDKNDGANDNMASSMQLDNEDDNEHALPPLLPNSAQSFKHFLFYNRKPNSLWYGLLVLREATAPNDQDAHKDNINTHWKFYTPSAEHAFLLIKTLFQELILNSCNVTYIACPTTKYKQRTAAATDVNVLELENAMRQELNALLQLIKENKKSVEQIKYAEFAKLQLQTDLLAVTIN